MKKILLLWAVLSITYSCAIAQSPEKKANTTAAVDEKEANKTVEKDNVCLLTDNDELKSLADGKITHPTSIPRVKKDISQLTSCAIQNIKIISGKDAGNTAEYIACVCGTKMIFKADYSMNIKTVTEL